MRFALLLLLGLICSLHAGDPATFRVGSYNIENYLITPTETRTEVKSASSRQKVREMIHKLRADVLALVEIGAPAALEELRQSLKAEGLNYPYSRHINGPDPSVYLAVLSKFPITADRSHTNENYLLNGKRFQVSRGLAEVDIQVNPGYRFTLFAAHFKSKRIVPSADQLDMRVEEARILREKVDLRMKTDPQANIVVLGDLNDTKDSPSTRTVIGRGRTKLLDTRPAEQNGDNTPSSNPAWEPRNVTWTHYYGKEDSYSRIDYILISEGMAREWITEKTHVLTEANWGVASDHRPIVATFTASDN